MDFAATICISPFFCLLISCCQNFKCGQDSLVLHLVARSGHYFSANVLDIETNMNNLKYLSFSPISELQNISDSSTVHPPQLL